jgi:hypothetical protein
MAVRKKVDARKMMKLAIDVIVISHEHDPPILTSMTHPVG